MVSIFDRPILLVSRICHCRFRPSTCVYQCCEPLEPESVRSAWRGAQCWRSPAGLATEILSWGQGKCGYISTTAWLPFVASVLLCLCLVDYKIWITDLSGHLWISSLNPLGWADTPRRAGQQIVQTQQTPRDRSRWQIATGRSLLRSQSLLSGYLYAASSFCP